jgi:bifunctional non-homologous end joining protein LigD
MSRVSRKTLANAPVLKESAKAITARFIEPMLVLPTDSLPSDPQWLYELKLDGYRAIGFKRNGGVSLRFRNDNDFNERYPPS